VAHDEELAKEANLDVEWHKPFHALLQRAVDAGYGDQSISALTEILKSPAPTA
jgi:3-hydroxyisobutyrate dehydrogenase-like beta-hydroxyacid dehydrogenase